MSLVSAEVLTPLLDDQVTRNKRRAALIVAGFVLAVTAGISLFGLLIGAGAAALVVAVVAAAALALAASWKADALALAMSDARPADPVAHARLHNLVEGLCMTAGLPKPRVHVIDDAALNAFATGRSPRHAAIAVTTGLTETMNRIELEGVLAHELSHVKNHDIAVSTLVVALLGPVALLLPVPTARLIEMAVGRRREALADLAGVAVTRYPPGLIAALEKLREGTTVVRSGSRATAHLWLACPVAGKDGRRFETHPPLEERIAVLREL
ncbi:MAG: M48 family metalloprotease [Actinomycetota bacterium]|nr:M48 family metalloprotease [Actinomycetota bacterium]